MKVTCGFTIPITKYDLPPSVDNIFTVMREISEAGFDTMEMEIVAGEYQDSADNWDKEKSNKAIEDYAKICDMTAETGANIKANSSYLNTFLVGNSNAHIHYAPNADSYKEWGYEVMNCLVAPEWQSMYEKEINRILKKM